jgi:photosystem II stability/assembly factor-like uncharacterized protein
MLSISSLEEDNAGNIYLCGSGLQRSTDNGETWIELYPGSVFDVTIPQANTIIIGIPGTFSGEFVVSTDNGATWNPTGYRINLLEFYEFNSALFAGGGFGDEDGGGVQKSIDNGLSWISSGLDSLTVTSFAGNSRNELFAGTSDGIFFSEDNGLTWENVLPDSFVRALTIRNDLLFAGTQNGTLLVSTDDGRTWR